MIKTRLCKVCKARLSANGHDQFRRAVIDHYAKNHTKAFEEIDKLKDKAKAELETLKLNYPMIMGFGWLRISTDYLTQEADE